MVEDADAIQAARVAVEALELPDELRPVAFGWLLNRHQAKGSTAEPNAPIRERTEAAEGPLVRVAQTLRLSADVLADVYFVRDGEIALGVPAASLEATTARGARQIALLLTAARQTAGIDDAYTDVALIRDACRDYGRFDQGNFAATIGAMTDVFTFRGRGQRREVRITRPGLDRARDLILRLSGNAD